MVTIVGSRNGMLPVPVPFVSSDKKNYEFMLGRIIPDREDPSKSKILLNVKLPEDASIPQKGETLVVEASVKPMINLVWVGTVTLVIGFFLTILRRIQEARL